MSRIELHYDLNCKFCGSDDIIKYGHRDGLQQYFCNDCKRKFNEKDTLGGKQTPIAEIGASLSMFYDGLSVSKISNQLKGIFNDDVEPSTIYRWIIEYSQRAIDIFEGLQLNIGDVWVVDETVISINGQKVWFWDIIDEQTRFLLASHLSISRTIDNVSIVMKKALDRAGKYPNFILSDKLPAYPEGIRRIFGDQAQHLESHEDDEEEDLSEEAILKLAKIEATNGNILAKKMMKLLEVESKKRMQYAAAAVPYFPPDLDVPLSIDYPAKLSTATSTNSNEAMPDVSNF